jgi:hypothetical protein
MSNRIVVACVCVCVRLLRHQAHFECAELPALREKLVDRSLFDVAQLLFIADVHMSLMMLLGSQSCRSDDALESGRPHAEKQISRPPWVARGCGPVSRQRRLRGCGCPRGCSRFVGFVRICMVNYGRDTAANCSVRAYLVVWCGCCGQGHGC